VGIKKYGTTLGAARLSRQELAQHALEEALDLANYLQTIIQADKLTASSVSALIADDGYAMSFQSIGQYRSALLAAVRNPAPTDVAKVAPQPVGALVAKGSHHPDDIAVQLFADAMKSKMAKARANGRDGWNNAAICPTERLQTMLLEHIAKGDPVDVANFCMMLWTRGAPVASAKPVTYLRWRACQINEGHGNIGHAEWFEECKPDQVGDDASPAFPVYGTPVARGAEAQVFFNGGWKPASALAYYCTSEENRRVIDLATPTTQQGGDQ
jgi:hypothetical protein